MGKRSHLKTKLQHSAHHSAKEKAHHDAGNPESNHTSREDDSMDNMVDLLYEAALQIIRVGIFNYQWLVAQRSSWNVMLLLSQKFNRVLSSMAEIRGDCTRDICGGDSALPNGSNGLLFLRTCPGLNLRTLQSQVGGKE